MVSKNLRVYGLGLFSAGLVIGLFFSIMIAWSDLEAYSFDSMWRPDEVFRLNCPALITQNETGVINMSFTSTLQQPIKLSVWTMISAASATAMDEDHLLLDMPAGGTVPLQLTVSREDAAYDRFIFVRVAQIRYYPMPERNGVCGIWVMPVSFLTGNVWVALFFLGAVGGLVGGAFLILRTIPHAQRGRKDYMPFILGGVVIASMLIAFWGTWFPAMFLIIVAILMTLEMVREVTSG